MKIAIAGTGNVAQYLMDEIKAYGHDFVVLTRRQKPGLNCPQRETDYSVASLVSVLKDCDALVSTVTDYTNPSSAIGAHLNMLEALKQTEHCKTFIPSEWTVNVEEYPEQPMSWAEELMKVHEVLKTQNEIKWTIICVSWFADFVVPNTQRYLRDVEGLFPMNHANKVFTTYGLGNHVVSMVSARDVARGVAALLDTKDPWEEYTYMSGQQLTWNDLFNIIKKRDPEWTNRKKPLSRTILQIASNSAPELALEHYLEILSYAGAYKFSEDKVRRQQAKYFKGVHFRTVEEILEQAVAQPDAII